MKNLAIITGGSRGIGKALVDCYVQKGYQVHTLSRKSTEQTENPAHHIADLSNTQETCAVMTRMLKQIDLKRLENFVLINNAGTLGPINSNEQQSPEEIRSTLHTNLTAPMILTALCLQKLSKNNGSKRVLNISSGAAKKAYEGWSAYCASKAGLDLFTKTVALEQKELTNGAKIAGIYPGVVETAMQIKLRNTPKKAFKNVQRFIDLKKENKLFHPEFVAQKITELDTKNRLKNGEIIDLRDL